MFKFLNDGSSSTNNLNKDIDPVISALELGAGIEELNTEAIKLDVLTKAEEALEKTIDLDNQIATHNLANRATVSYGIEALEVTAIFLGADINTEELAAGLEDNDQEGVAKQKEGFLEKIKNAAKNAFEKIMNLIEKIIEKVKSFFQSKNVEKVSEELEQGSEEVERTTGSPNKAPDCSDDENVIRIKKGIIEVLGITGEHIKLKSTKDFGELIDIAIDKGIKDYLKSISEMFDEKKIDEIIGIIKEANNLNTTNKDANKITKELLRKMAEVVKGVKIPSAKQHPITEKIKSEFKDKVLKEAGIKGPGIKDEFEYSILLYGQSTIKNKDKVKIQLHFIVVSKNITAINNVEQLESIVKSNVAKGSGLASILDKISIKNVTIDVDDFSPRKYLSHIEPFSAEELRKLSKAVKEFNEQSNDFYEEVRRDFGKFRDQAHKVMKKMESLTGLQMPKNFKAAALSISGIVSSSAKLLPMYLTKLSKDIKRLSVACGTKAAGNPFK